MSHLVHILAVQMELGMYWYMFCSALQATHGTSSWSGMYNKLWKTNKCLSLISVSQVLWLFLKRKKKRCSTCWRQGSKSVTGERSSCSTCLMQIVSFTFFSKRLPGTDILSRVNYIGMPDVVSAHSGSTNTAQSVPRLAVNKMVYGYKVSDYGRMLFISPEQKNLMMMKGAVHKFSKPGQLV